jgi:hypothetical protein
VHWFARGHGGFLALKARFRASQAVRQARVLLDGLRCKLRQGRRRLARVLRWRRKARFGSRHAGRTARVLRRFVVLWRARRR